jgi:phosphatidylserine decarboxylase
MLAVVVAVVVGWLFLPAVVLPLIVWFGAMWFFRDPDRRAPNEPGVLLSPADGRVRDVTPVRADSELGRCGVKIGIFMSLFDVHVNRSPAGARVESVVYRPGVFLDARHLAASERNESATIRLICRQGQASYPLIVRQVAGWIARRIVTDVAIGQELTAGQRIGMIKFGSRVELIVPVELAGEIRIVRGQKVRAGETVLVAAARRMNDGL